MPDTLRERIAQAAAHEYVETSQPVVYMGPRPAYGVEVGEWVASVAWPLVEQAIREEREKVEAHAANDRGLRIGYRETLEAIASALKVDIERTTDRGAILEALAEKDAQIAILEKQWDALEAAWMAKRTCGACEEHQHVCVKHHERVLEELATANSTLSEQEQQIAALRGKLIGLTPFLLTHGLADPLRETPAQPDPAPKLGWKWDAEHCCWFKPTTTRETPAPPEPKETP